MRFIYDTGSSWMWVPIKGCKGCPTGNLLDSTLSTSFIDSTSAKELFYGKGYVNGTISFDIVSATGEIKQGVNLKLLAVNAAKDLEGTKADGILGLSPTELVNGSSFVLQLYNAKIIPH
jgi:hypothetical protein